jgi:hypothetical protein
MPNSYANSIHRKLVKATVAYLGPSAERFVDRQITNHLNKSPAELTRSDLASLIDWIRITVSLLTDNTEVIEEYISQLKKISAEDKPKRVLNRGSGA